MQSDNEPTSRGLRLKGFSQKAFTELPLVTVVTANLQWSTARGVMLGKCVEAGLPQY